MDVKHRALFAYGSLVSEDEVKRLVGGLRKSVTAKLRGFRRECCVKHIDPEFGFLGVIKDRNCFINGSVLFLNDSDILCLDKEEFLYHRENIDVSDIFFNTEKDEKTINVIKGLTVQIYVPDKNNIYENIELLPSYRKLVWNAFKKKSPEFYDDFIKTTKFREQEPQHPV